MSPFRFADPWALLGLLLLVAVALSLRSRPSAALAYSGLPLFDGIAPTLWVRLRWLPDALRAVAIMLAVLAAARPQVLAEPEARDVEAIDVIVALDVSTSMRAADFRPRDRLFVAKQSVADFIRQRDEDRIGLLVFAGQASSWTPLTLDYELVLELLAQVEAGMLPDGTAIGTAIGTALVHLRSSEAETKAIVLITDGDNTKGNITPREAARIAAEEGVTLYTIAIGEGGLVPYPVGKDLFGNVRYRKERIPVDRELLAELAETTGGAAFVARDGEALDSNLAAILDALDRTRLQSGMMEASWRDLFPRFLLAALALLALERVLRATRWRTFP